MLFYFSVIIISGGEFHLRERENLFNKRGSVEKHQVLEGDPVSLRFLEKNNRDTVPTSH